MRSRSLCYSARGQTPACQACRQRKTACHSPVELSLRFTHRPLVLGSCLEIVSPSLRIYLGLELAMELALSGIGRMASRGEQWKSLDFQAGSERRGGSSNRWVTSQLI